MRGSPGLVSKPLVGEVLAFVSFDFSSFANLAASACSAHDLQTGTTNKFLQCKFWEQHKCATSLGRYQHVWPVL